MFSHNISGCTSLYNWYRNLKGVVKWNDIFSNVFDVTRGTRQWSVRSPYSFNIFLNDLLIQLKEGKFGVNIGTVIEYTTASLMQMIFHYFLFQFLVCNI